VAHLLNPPPTRWVCSNGCGVTDVTPAGVPNRFHVCRVLRGITAPLVAEGSVVRVRAVEREDYVGDEVVQYDTDGRPIMAVVTDRPDGSNDVVVMAPTASWSAKGM
jgi:hypothetical protein